MLLFHNPVTVFSCCYSVILSLCSCYYFVILLLYFMLLFRNPVTVFSYYCSIFSFFYLLSFHSFFLFIFLFLHVSSCLFKLLLLISLLQNLHIPFFYYYFWFCKTSFPFMSFYVFPKTSTFFTKSS